ncbi:sporulation initiation phosphotransferase F [Oxobacter pfennigii]|uniref:Stage 0 sporulation protein A homolog n=1 Tax=Oxobacter pfennigii TaxID=36849 RepID=A0A0P8W6T9_9CLOT|nr:response regulator [Oxobacter pfennigii]KPU43770.1 sporulation initiation phosphotransferase F [Oxobacter pfennigii]
MNNSLLVIDDEKNIRIMLAKCLESEGYKVDWTEDGIKGLELFGANKYDVVLLDMKMPGLSGIEVLKKLKEIDKDISVIMMTAYGTIESAVEAMKLGAVDYIKKPFAPDIIRSEVKIVLDRINLNPADTKDFLSSLQYAKKCMVSKDYINGKKYLMKSLSFDTNSPEVYNLLGVLEEYNNELHDAQKYYRMALCIDYTYEPANKNLQRTAQFIYTSEGIELGYKNNPITDDPDNANK